MKEMRRYKIGILGISECRWSGFGRLKVQTGKQYYFLDVKVKYIKVE